VRSNGIVTVTVSHLDSLESLSERTDLVDLDEDSVAASHLDTLLQELVFGDEEVVTDELHLLAEGLAVSFTQPSQSFSSRPSSIEVDRILVAELLEVSDLALIVELLAIRILRHAVGELLVVVEPLAVLLISELTGSAVHGDGHILARLVASILDSLTDALECVVDAVEFAGA
jgi:hypothetical protein